MRTKQLSLQGLDCGYHHRDPYEMIHILKRVMVQPRRPPAEKKVADSPPPLQSGKTEMLDNTKIVRRRASRAQGEIIAKLLREHCKPIGHPQDKICEYDH